MLWYMAPSETTKEAIDNPRIFYQRVIRFTLNPTYADFNIASLETLLAMDPATFNAYATEVDEIAKAVKRNKPNLGDMDIANILKSYMKSQHKNGSE